VSENGLSRLLRGVPPERFFDRYWERRPLLVRGDGAARVAPLLSIRDLDSVLCGLSLSSADVRLVRSVRRKIADRPVPSTPGGGADFYELYRAYAEGWTLILNGIELRWAPVARLCRSLEGDLRHRVGANLYFTPPRARGFLPHYDTHDVFVVQLEGTKAWRLRESRVRLPIPEQKETAETGRPVKRGRVILEPVLRAGDVLYIPRGCVHEARTTGRSSLHLTIGVHAHLWRDLLGEILSHAADADVELRRAVMFDDADVDGASRAIARRASRLLARIARSVDAEQAIDRLTGRLMSRPTPSPDGHFASLDRMPAIALDTRVRRREGMWCSVRRTRGGAVLRFPGNRVGGPAAIEPALHYVAHVEGPFAVRDLPASLTDHAKRVLARRLVKEGLLRIEDRRRDGNEEEAREGPSARGEDTRGR
jgi:ribosomal protein L16 Arg81 hydroxylase